MSAVPRPVHDFADGEDKPISHASPALKRRLPVLLPLLLGAALLSAGCERLGIEDPAKLAAAREAEGKAVGAGCRHAGRSLEECYSLNEDAHKAAVFAGWREMNDYMAANNIAAVPQLAQAASAAEPAVDAAQESAGRNSKSAQPSPESAADDAQQAPKAHKR